MSFVALFCDGLLCENGEIINLHAYCLFSASNKNIVYFVFKYKLM